MPKVIVKAAPGPDIAGRFALGAGIRQKFKPDGSVEKDANGNPQYWPARSGVFIPVGQDTELTITDEELRDLQSGANAQLFTVVVTDQAAQPSINEGGSSMATQPINQPPNQPGTTVPPGTSPTPTNPPPPQGPPVGAPAPGSPAPAQPATTPGAETTPGARTAKK